jgi:hypothetical protein
LQPQLVAPFPLCTIEHMAWPLLTQVKENAVQDRYNDRARTRIRLGVPRSPLPRPEKEPLLAAQPELNPLAHNFKENPMSLGTILLIVLILLLIGAFPAWPHSSSWGYAPVGGLGLVLIIVVVLLVMGRL